MVIAPQTNSTAVTPDMTRSTHPETVMDGILPQPHDAARHEQGTAGSQYAFSMKSKVAVVRTSVGTVFEDVRRAIELGGGSQALDPRATTILKDNISWHFPFPGANTTPWQLEGTIRALRQAGFEDQVCVQNKTVVTDAFKGEDLNGYVPIFERYGIPVRYLSLIHI